MSAVGRRGRFSLACAFALPGAIALHVPAARAMPGSWEHPFTTSGLGGPVYALREYQGQLIAAGLFSSAGGQPASNIARWDGERWWPLGAGISGGASSDGSASFVYSLCVHDGDLIAAGAFTSVGGAPASNLGRWDGRDWHPYPATFNGIIFASDSFGGDLVVGGRFTRIDGQLRRYFSGLHGSEWRAANIGLNELASATVHWDGRLAVAGAFSRADNVPASGVAVWNGAWWEPLGAGMAGGDPRTWVFALTVFRGELIAGGVFTHADGRLVNGIARWDGVTWQPLGSGILSREEVWVFALASYGDRLIVGGAFTHAGGGRVNYIAAWDGSAWSDLGGGTDGWVRSFCVLDARLHVGGHFSLAGGQPAPGIARWRSDPVSIGRVAFAAERLDAVRARVRIQTAAGAEATAFHVHRAQRLADSPAASAAWTRITPAPITAAPGSPLTVDDLSAPPAATAYWLEELRAEGSTWHGPAVLAPGMGDLPTALALAPVAPNPFVAATRIDFALAGAAAVDLRVLDLRGRTVVRLLDTGLASGAHSIAWDGRDASGAPAARGTYIVRLQADGRETARRVTLTGR